MSKAGYNPDNNRNAFLVWKNLSISSQYYSCKACMGHRSLDSDNGAYCTKSCQEWGKKNHKWIHKTLRGEALAKEYADVTHRLQRLTRRKSQIEEELNEL